MTVVDLHLGPFWFGAAGIGNLGRVVTDEDAAGAVEAAWDSGVRAFDTAPHYGLGLSEQRLGSALRGRPRDEFLVSTKVGRLLERTADPSGLDADNGFLVPANRRRVWDASEAGIRRSLDESRNRLGTDRIDVAFLHDPDEYDTAQSLRTGLPALAALREEGAVDAVGVGSKSVDALLAAAESGLADVLMVAGRYTLLEQPALALLDRCAELGVEVIAAGVFNSGLLSTVRPDSTSTYEYDTAPAAIVERTRRIAAICEAHGVTLPEAAIAFPHRHPAVRAVAIGAQTAEQVRQNAARAEVRTPDALWAALGDAGFIN